MKTAIEPAAKKCDTGGYSSGVLADGWLYVSGQGSVDLATGSIIQGSVEEQTLKTLQNLEGVLKEAGGTRADLVKCSVHLADIADFKKFDAVYRSFFEGVVMPARTTVGSALPGIKVEIDAIAYLGTTK